MSVHSHLCPECAADYETVLPSGANSLGDACFQCLHGVCRWCASNMEFDDLRQARRLEAKHRFPGEDDPRLFTYDIGLAGSVVSRRRK